MRPRALAAALIALPAVLGHALPAAAQRAPAVRYDIGDDQVEGVLAPRSVRPGAVVGGAVTLSAVYELPVAGPVLDARLSLELPADGLATAARVRHGRARIRADLLPAAAAQARFDAVSGRTGAGAPGAAVLLTHDPTAVDVIVAWPHPGPATLTLELDVSAPTCVHGGRRLVGVPAAWGSALAAPAPTDAGLDELEEACGRSAEAWYTLEGAPTSRPPAAAPARLTADRLALGATHVARLEVVVGALGEAPADLATVIVADASRSLSERQRQLQRELIAAYARATPASKLQVIAYARTAQPLLPAWTTARAGASAAAAALADLAPRNGSNLDAGLAQAAAWLGRVRGTRRVVLLTDELLARRLATTPPAGLAAALPAGTLVHVVTLDQTGRALARDDAATLAPLAAATAGLSARIGERMAGTRLDARALVHPVSLDAVAIHGAGWSRFEPAAGAACPADGPALPERAGVPEGRGCTWWAIGDAAAGAITVEGWLWGRKVTQRATPASSAAASVALARTLVASTPPAGLADAVAAAARAVTPTHSLVATWGGAGAWADYATAEVRGTWSASHPSGGGRSSTHGRASSTVIPPEDLAPQLRPALAACGLAGVAVPVVLETTRDEIVAVQVTLPPAHAARQACVEDALWDVPLQLAHPLAFRAHRLTL